MEKKIKGEGRENWSGDGCSHVDSRLAGSRSDLLTPPPPLTRSPAFFLFLYVYCAMNMQFFDLASHHSAWNSRLGAAFSLGNIITLHNSSGGGGGNVQAAAGVGAGAGGKGANLLPAHLAVIFPKLYR
jgi:hypothetical protein